MKDVATMKVELKKLIDTAAGRVPADLVIKNCKIVNVFSGKIQEGDIAFSGNQIAGIGEYEGVKVIDAEGRYAAPGFIDSHIHIESSYVSPEEIGRLLVPHGGTTIMDATMAVIITILIIEGIISLMINIVKQTIFIGRSMNESLELRFENYKLEQRIKELEGEIKSYEK